MKRLTINVGFITNSSSVIHWVDAAVLKDPEVAAFIAAYGLEGGVIGDELWNRSECGSFLPDNDIKNEFISRLKSNDYCYMDKIVSETDEEPDALDFMSDAVAVVYGDECDGIFHELSNLLNKAANKNNLKQASMSYN